MSFVLAVHLQLLVDDELLRGRLFAPIVIYFWWWMVTQGIILTCNNLQMKGENLG